MSYARNPDPQILSIEAIIQKSEFKSKILNNIPTDLKKLFMEQASTTSTSKVNSKHNYHENRRISTGYEPHYFNTIENVPSASMYRTKKVSMIPPLPSGQRQRQKQKQTKSQSLNNSKLKINSIPHTNVHSQQIGINGNNYNYNKNKTITIQTTRTINRNTIHSRQRSRQKEKDKQKQDNYDDRVEQCLDAQHIMKGIKDGSSINNNNNRKVKKAQSLKQSESAHGQSMNQELIDSNAENDGNRDNTRDLVLEREKQGQTTDNNVNINSNKQVCQKSMKLFNRFQYQLVLPEKDRKNVGLKKVIKQKINTNINANNVNDYNNDQQKQTALAMLDNKQLSQQIILYHNNHNKIGMKQTKSGFIAKRSTISHGNAEIIPDFVMAAINNQQGSKKISPMKNFQPPSSLGTMGMGEQCKSQQKLSRYAKPPVCVMNMKKKINYNRVRRSEQSCQNDELLEPKVNLIKIIEKQRERAKQKQQKILGLTRKSSDVVSSQKKIRKERVPTLDRLRKKKNNVDDQLKGWDVIEGGGGGPQFFDY